MAQPDAYEREFDFSDYQSANPSDPLPAPHVDAELNRIKLTTDQIRANLAVLQNDDTSLRALVDYDQLTGALLADIGALEGEEARLTALEADVASLETLKAPLASPTFTGTVGGITKSMVGLGSVDNTSDAAKPVSTATQTALDLKADAAATTSALALKAPLANPAFTGTVSGITKSMVGLGSVDNTSDAAKPVSTATQTALDLKQNIDQDLTDISALTPSNDDFLQRKTGAWTNRTPTQVTADLNAFVGDSGSGGTKGLVPAPLTGDATKFLRGDGQFANPAGAGGDVSGPASSTTNTIVGFDGTTGKLIKQLTAAQAQAAAGVALIQIGAKQTVGAGGAAAVVFTDIPATGHFKFILVGIDVASEQASNTATLRVQVSTDNGSTFKTTSGDYYVNGTTAAVGIATATVPGANSTFQHGYFAIELMGLGNAGRATAAAQIVSIAAISTSNVVTAVPSATNNGMRVAVETDNAFRIVTADGSDIAAGSTFILYGLTET